MQSPDVSYFSLTVFCTCSEAGSVRVVDIKPTNLIIDEAAMATEPEQIM